ncbi:TraB/GumN family protein [Aurantiacibacter gilvus]|uniref:TraB/GumN family protein n=1 Tax=Aurantiacibacter gilvus TaxID=3139141 RepID=A0ABU9IET0_9SPHN
MTSPSGEMGWLFGTVHALPSDMDWGTPLLDETFDQAGVLVVEIADLDASYGRRLIADLSTTPGQPPLPDRVDDDERPALLALMDDAGMDSDDFADVETWAAALTLSGATRVGDPRNGVDRTLISVAGSAGLEVIGLETYGAQLSLFDTLSEAAQSDLLNGVAEAHARQSEGGMLVAWVTGDADEMGEQVNASLAGSPELRRVLLVDRNRDWTLQIMRLVDAGRAPFVAVGAGHLSGEESVVQMLQARGYETRRIQ